MVKVKPATPFHVKDDAYENVKEVRYNFDGSRNVALVCECCGTKGGDVHYYDINGYMVLDPEANAQNPDALAHILCTGCEERRAWYESKDWTIVKRPDGSLVIYKHLYTVLGDDAVVLFIDEEAVLIQESATKFTIPDTWDIDNLLIEFSSQFHEPLMGKAMCMLTLRDAKAVIDDYLEFNK